jgi:hypothetical protein
MYLITLKVFKMFAPITKVNEGESNTLCRRTLEVTYSSVEKLSKALQKVPTCLGLSRISNKRSSASCPFDINSGMLLWGLGCMSVLSFNKLSS